MISASHNTVGIVYGGAARSRLPPGTTALVQAEPVETSQSLERKEVLCYSGSRACGWKRAALTERPASRSSQIGWADPDTAESTDFYYVSSVDPSGAAEVQGVKPGDIVS